MTSARDADTALARSGETGVIADSWQGKIYVLVVRVCLE